MAELFAYLFWAAVAAGLSYAISALTTKVPKQDEAPPNALTEPDVREGMPYPIIFGTCYIENPCIAWYGDIEIAPLVDHTTINTGFNNKRVYSTIGYEYRMGLHFILCQGSVDGIKQIKNNDTVIWPTAKDITAVNVDGASETEIDEPNVFGGRYSGGGVVGTVTFLYGDSAQARNSYLETQLGSDVSAYRGVTSVVLEHTNIGNSPYLQPWKFLVKRTDVLTDNSEQWYISKAVINTYDLNPAHILRECYTNTDWGFGISSGLFQSSVWEAFADDLYNEGFGLTMKWDRENQSLYDFVEDVKRHVDCKVYQDPVTGYIVPKLLRDDYVEDDLDIYDESDIVSINDNTTGVVYEGINTIEMSFWDRLFNTEIVVPDHDIASYTMQSSKRINQSVRYYGIMNKTLAGKVTARERMQIGSYPKIMILKTKRTMGTLRPGDVFKLSYAPLEIEEMVMRVEQINFGTLTNGQLTIKCIQDKFSIQTALFAEIPDTVWSNPDLSPSESPSIKVIETPYYLVKQFLSSDEYFDEVKDTTDGFVTVMAAFANNSPDFELEFRADAGDSFVDYGTNQYTHVAVLAENMLADAQQVTLDYSSITINQDVTFVNRISRVGTVNYVTAVPAFIGNEILFVTQINYTNSTITAYRGALDTVPETHSIGDYIYFPSYFTTFLDGILIPDGDIPGAKIYPNTPTGTLDSTSIINADEFDSRLVRPYPPDDIFINGSSFASSFSGQPTLSWYNRDRTNINEVQYTGLHTGSAEAGTTYKLEIYDETLTNLIRIVNPAISPYEYTWENEMDDCGLGSGDALNTQLRFVLTSIRDGYDSFQSIDITVQRT